LLWDILIIDEFRKLLTKLSSIVILWISTVHPITLSVVASFFNVLVLGELRVVIGMVNFVMLFPCIFL